MPPGIYQHHKNPKHSIWMKEHNIIPPSRKGIKLSDELKERIRINSNPWNKGKKFSLESRKKMRLAKLNNPVRYWLNKKRLDISLGQMGEKNKMWKGGISSVNTKIRNSKEYKDWRKKVIERDGKCVLCDSIENLRADHIKPQSLYPELRFDINNGRTICFKCDLLSNTFGGRVKKLTK